MTIGNPNIDRSIQSLTPGDKVELFVLDLNPLGMDPADLPAEGKLYFSPSSIGENLITFRGKQYSSVPIQAEGFEVSGRGALAQPTLRMANVNNLAGSIAASYEDLVGAVLTRTVTFRQFLDDGAMADPDAVIPSTVWEVLQKTKQNKLYIEWKMGSFLDREGEEIPKRKVWKHTCMWSYRTFNAKTGEFDYTDVLCPYAGTAYFDKDGNPTTADKDLCGKRVRDCKLRYGAKAVLPHGGFLGVNDR